MDDEAVVAQVTKAGRLYMGLVFLTIPVLVGVAMFGKFKPPDVPVAAIYAFLAIAVAAAPIGLTVIWTKMLTYQALPGGDRPKTDEGQEAAALPPKAKAFTERLAILNGVVEIPGMAAFVGLVMGLPVEACAAVAAVGLLCALWAFVEIPKKARRVLVERQ